MVCKKLQWNHCQYGRKLISAVRNMYNTICVPFKLLAALLRNGNYIGASGFYLQNVGDQFLEKFTLGSQSHNKSILFNQGNGAVLELPGRHSKGIDEGYIFKIQ